MTDSYKNARLAPTDLANGRVLAPGEAVPSSALDLSDGTHDDRLVQSGALVPSAADAQTKELAGDALKARAAELNIEGRSGMNADQLRQAIAEAEKAAGEGGEA